MDIYRTAPQCPVSGDRLAFRDARIRIGADRFELSFGREWKHLVLVGCAALVALGPSLVVLVDLPRLVLLVIAVAAGCLTLAFSIGVLAGDRHFVVTRHGSWGVSTFLGLRFSSRPLGHHPKVANLGYDWEELAVYPRDQHLCAGLLDNERFVLVEWAGGDEARCRDGAHLQEIARAEILRLQGPAPTLIGDR